MCPAALADIVRRLHVEPLARVQSLDQLEAQLSLARVVLTFDLQLPQPLARTADDELTESHALSAATQLVEGVAHRLRLSDRVTWKARGHRVSGSTRYSTDCGLDTQKLANISAALGQ